MPDDFTFDVFLSHSSHDKSIVRPLTERLRKDGLRVWFDEWELRPGDSIPSKIEAGPQRKHSRVLVLCLAAQAFGSDWAQLESGTFRFRDPLNKDRRFVPLRLDDAPTKVRRTFQSHSKSDTQQSQSRRKILWHHPTIFHHSKRNHSAMPSISSKS